MLPAKIPRLTKKRMYPIIMRANVIAAKLTNSHKNDSWLSLQPEHNEISNVKENEDTFFHGFIKCD